ncbi:MFS general substrate transporter [Cenococcum geophilum]
MTIPRPKYAFFVRDAISEADPVSRGLSEPQTNVSDLPDDLEKQQDDAAVAETTIAVNDEDLIDWDGPNDPKKPMNWKNSRKAKNIIVICYCTFLTPLGSTIFAPAVGEVMATYHSSNPQLASFVVSVFILGYFFGPLFLAPLNSLPVYLTCNVLFTVFNIACAASDSLGSLVVFRFLAGTFGGCPITIGAGSFGDMIAQEHRGGIIAIWALGPLLGPVVGPVAGGFLGQNAGWRWVLWLLSIAVNESYPPVLLQKKAKRLQKETGNTRLRSVLDTDRRASHVFARSIIRPINLLFRSPIVATLSIYQGIIYGYLYLLFTTITLIFQYQYGFSQGIVGLAYLGIGVGSLIGLGVAGAVSDRLLKKLTREGVMKPEYRLPPLIPACFFIPIGLFWYGWSAQAHTHWIVPILGTMFIGIGLTVLFMCVATYFIDAYPYYEASATAASTAVRSLIGALLPLAGRSLYSTIGLGWGNSLLGFMALAMCPLPWFFYKYGERIRTNPKYQIKM